VDLALTHREVNAAQDDVAFGLSVEVTKF